MTNKQREDFEKQLRQRYYQGFIACLVFCSIMLATYLALN
jgi:hypothetical protein